MAHLALVPTSRDSVRMPGYRAFGVRPDDSLTDAFHIMASSDEDALAMARHVMACDVYELWHGMRLIARIDASERLAMMGARFASAS